MFKKKHQEILMQLLKSFRSGLRGIILIRMKNPLYKRQTKAYNRHQRQAAPVAYARAI
jgi:hypothetical protein